MDVINMSKYEVGNVVTGNVTGIEKYGIFVSLDEYYSGLIHISEISDNFVRDVNDYVKYGDTIKAKIIEVDDDSFHVKLSIKDMNHKAKIKNKRQIIETGSGFGILEDNLDKWINIKIEEIEKNKNKN
jgi:general stress protein 13